MSFTTKHAPTKVIKNGAYNIDYFTEYSDSRENANNIRHK